jgi:hypothetical protein
VGAKRERAPRRQHEVGGEEPEGVRRGARK